MPKAPYKVLFVTNRHWTAPSAKVRVFQYKDLFEIDTGWQAECVDIASQGLDRIINTVNAFPLPGVKRVFTQLVHKLMRIHNKWIQHNILNKAKTSNLVYLLKVMDLSLYHSLKRCRETKLCFDFVDGLWLPVHRKLCEPHPTTLHSILELVDAVICENKYTAEYAHKHCPNVHIIPDATPVEKFEVVRGRKSAPKQRIVIGWIGSPWTIRPLICLLDTLDRLAKQGLNVELRVLGGRGESFASLESLPFHAIPVYDEELMLEEVARFDIGLFPISPNVDGLTRGIGKALIYMAAGAAVVATKYGEITNVINDGINGILVAQNSDWSAQLTKVITNEGFRLALAKAGLATVEKSFARNVVHKQLIATFNNIVDAA